MDDLDKLKVYCIFYKQSNHVLREIASYCNSQHSTALLSLNTLCTCRADSQLKLRKKIPPLKKSRFWFPCSYFIHAVNEMTPLGSYNNTTKRQ